MIIRLGRPHGYLQRDQRGLGKIVVRGGLAGVSGLAMLAATTGPLWAGDAGAPASSQGPAVAPAAEQSTNEVLLKKLQEMEAHIQRLEAQVKQSRGGDGAGVTSKAPVKADAKGAVTGPGGKEVVNLIDNGGAKQAAAPAVAAPVKGADGKEVINLINGEAGAGSVAPAAALAPAPGGVAGSLAPGLTFGGYGEMKFGSFQNPNATPAGQRQIGFDAARAVLAPTYAFTNNIIFNAELEFEHGGFARDSDDKLAGSIDVEQIFIDFKFADWFNWRSPGVDLVPFGYINEHHEPNQFYSVNRPELYLGLIPSTWRTGATRLYGNLGNGVSYALQAGQSLEDYGDSFSSRTDGGAVAPVAYAGGIDGFSALGLSRPPVGNFQQLNDTIAYGGRLEYQPEWLPGFAGSVSGYYSPNITPRGAHAGVAGAALGSDSLGMFDVEFRYRPATTNFEFRGEFVGVEFGTPANLRANNDSDPANNVGKRQYGYSGEVAYHFPLGTIIGSQWEAIPFYRYTFENLQTGGFAGSDVNQPTGAGRMQFHTAGIAVVPSDKVELKATYQHAISDQPGGPKSDYLLGGVGFQF